MSQRRRLPPLNAVRAFEAAARLGGFVAASEELAVTPSAVSQQVKGLEEWLGVRLFVRRAQGLERTAAARQYLPGLTEALDRIDDATAAVLPKPSSRVLTVTSLASFSAQWLAPRLPSFAQAYPDIDLRLSTTDRMLNLEIDDVDVAIRYGHGQYGELEVEKLVEEWVTPVCAPSVSMGGDRAPPITRLDDLKDCILMHDSTAILHARHGQPPVQSWSGWLDAAERPDLKQVLPIDRGPAFSDSHFLVQAAVAGTGVMLGRGVLVADPLSTGTLVAPIDIFMPSPEAYWFVTMPGARADKRIAAFREWLVAEMADLWELKESRPGWRKSGHA